MQELKEVRPTCGHYNGSLVQPQSYEKGVEDRDCEM